MLAGTLVLGLAATATGGLTELGRLAGPGWLAVFYLGLVGAAVIGGADRVGVGHLLRPHEVLAARELGFDAAIDYKAEDVKKSLRQHCPQGIDVYFDNVGGDILDAALTQITRHARIVICGAISQNAIELDAHAPAVLSGVCGTRM